MDEAWNRFAEIQKRVKFSQRAPAAWNELREYLMNYWKEHSYFTANPERYCVAISIEDLLKKMDEIENTN